MPMLTEVEEDDFWENCLTHGEREAIGVALASNKPWSEGDFQEPIKPNLGSAKVKLKDFHMARTGDRCCYCCRSLLDAAIESDREHIVPKGKMKSLTYRVFNLSIACKRCNMTYKRETTRHIVDYQTIADDLRNSARYLIPHPNIDNYEDHLIRRSVQLGDREIVAYQRLTEKGEYLFNFVNLSALCVGELDAAQGGKKLDELFANLLELPIEGA